jgi:hypothetical protein
MKTLFFLLIPFLGFSQITQRDTVVSIGGTLYLQHIVTTSELLVDTFAIRARINEIDATISALSAEKEKKKSLISDFEEMKPLEAFKSTKKPARKPKKSKQ